MPSGFQQDKNQLQPNYYRVNINTSAYDSAADAPENGRVTPYSADTYTTGAPVSNIVGQTRARGVVRFENIVRRLSGLTDCQIIDVSSSEDPNVDLISVLPTAVSFTVRYERDAFIPTTGLMVDGTTPITSVATAVQNAVASAILEETTRLVRVWNGDDISDSQQLLTISPPVTTATLAIASVAVDLEVNTTLIDA